MKNELSPLSSPHLAPSSPPHSPSSSSDDSPNHSSPGYSSNDSSNEESEDSEEKKKRSALSSIKFSSVKVDALSDFVPRLSSPLSSPREGESYLDISPRSSSPLSNNFNNYYNFSNLKGERIFHLKKKNSSPSLSDLKKNPNNNNNSPTKNKFKSNSPKKKSRKKTFSFLIEKEIENFSSHENDSDHSHEKNKIDSVPSSQVLNNSNPPKNENSKSSKKNLFNSPQSINSNTPTLIFSSPKNGNNGKITPLFVPFDNVEEVKDRSSPPPNDFDFYSPNQNLEK